MDPPYAGRDRPAADDARHSLWHPVSFIRRDLFDRHGSYDTTFRICGDYDWFFNVVVDKHATTRHLNQIIAIHDFTGVSSRPENAPAISQERQRAQQKGLSNQQIERFWLVERL
jgi:hypothetical protein